MRPRKTRFDQLVKDFMRGARSDLGVAEHLGAEAGKSDRHRRHPRGVHGIGRRRCLTRLTVPPGVGGVRSWSGCEWPAALWSGGHLFVLADTAVATAVGLARWPKIDAQGVASTPTRSAADPTPRNGWPRHGRQQRRGLRGRCLPVRSKDRRQDRVRVLSWRRLQA